MRKVAFLGSHSASLASCPWFDPSWEFWGHASSRAWYKHEAHRYFDTHRPECWTIERKGGRYMNWLKSNTVPIYMQDKYPDIPASRKYPKDRLLAEYGGVRDYAKNHFAWMAMMALAEGVQTIGVWGINYGHVSEYVMQRGSAEYWLGRLEGAGVRLIIPDECTLLAEPKGLYGYESHDKNGKLVDAYRERIPKPAETILPIGQGGEKYELAKLPAHLKDQIAQDEMERPAWANPALIGRSDGQAQGEA
jgi:hypothetical protein